MYSDTRLGYSAESGTLSADSDTRLARNTLLTFGFSSVRCRAVAPPTPPPDSHLSAGFAPRPPSLFARRLSAHAAPAQPAVSRAPTAHPHAGPRWLGPARAEVSDPIRAAVPAPRRVRLLRRRGIRVSPRFGPEPVPRRHHGRRVGAGFVPGRPGRGSRISRRACLAGLGRKMRLRGSPPAGSPDGPGAMAPPGLAAVVWVGIAATEEPRTLRGGGGLRAVVSPEGGDARAAAGRRLCVSLTAP